MKVLDANVQARLDRATVALERMERERLRLSPAPYLPLMFGRIGMHRRLTAPGAHRMDSSRYTEPSGVHEVAHAFEADRATTLPLLFAGIVHARLQTLRLFGPQSGAMSRLVTLLLLTPESALGASLLSPSLYLRRHRGSYYRLLDGVRDSAAWDPWLSFFADSVAAAARNSLLTARRLSQLLDTDRDRMEVLGTAARSARTVHAVLQRQPMATIGSLVRETGLGVQSVTWALHRLRALGVVRETTGRRQRCVYSYDRYLAVLASGTDSPTGRTPRRSRLAVFTPGMSSGASVSDQTAAASSPSPA